MSDGHGMQVSAGRLIGAASRGYNQRVGMYRPMWSDFMKVQINGQWERFEQAPTVAELLDARGLPAKRVAVELNRQILPRGLHAETRLSDNDSLEIVTLVGGG